MVIEGSAAVLGFGSAGGALAELLHWWNLRQNNELPEYAKRALYWVVTLVMIVASGFVAWVYFGERAEAVLALHVGISTPLLLQKLVTSVPRTEGSKSMVAKPAPSLRRFFTW